MTEIYKRGNIYKLVCNTTGLCYIGSSTQKTLAKRLGQHKDHYKLWKNEKHHFVTFKILENDNYEMILIEKFSCNSKDELQSRERYWIENTECVNKHIPTRTHKEYREANKEHLFEYGKE